MDILKHYKIELVDGKFGKQIFTINENFSACLNNFCSIKEVNLLLSFIDEVINKEVEIEYPTKSLSYIVFTKIDIIIYADTELWDIDNGIVPDFTLPTEHFKIIVEEWKKFLQ